MVNYSWVIHCVVQCQIRCIFKIQGENDEFGQRSWRSSFHHPSITVEKGITCYHRSASKDQQTSRRSKASAIVETISMDLSSNGTPASRKQNPTPRSQKIRSGPDLGVTSVKASYFLCLGFFNS
jgi:hypothetical protein